MKHRRFTDAGVAKMRAFQPQRYFIAFAAGSFGVWESVGNNIVKTTFISTRNRAAL